MSGRYVTARSLAVLERSLSDRDRAIVETLDRFRVATTVQLRRLHFADLTPASASRQAPKVLRRLAEQRVLVRLPRQVGGIRAGSAATIWALDLAGQRLSESGCNAAGGFRSRRPWAPGLPFLAHRLAITSAYTELAEAERAGRCRILDFEAEPYAWRRYADPHGGQSHLKPDGFVRLRAGQWERGAFLEIDRATEATPTVARKCTAYRRHWESGREQERRGYYPQVVFAVPDEPRRAALAAVCERQPEEARPLFQVVLARGLTDALIGGEVA